MSEPVKVSLVNFVPPVLAQRAAKDVALLDTPALDVFPAAVMFADISGFMALSERLAGQGPVGAEKLTEFLNGYFGKMITLVVAHGGDVVKFAGDALLAVWRASDQEEALSEATLLAAQCALEIQAALKEFAAEDARLILRISIGAGQAIGMLLGNARGRKEYLLTGWPVVQALTADQRAKPGDVALTGEAHTLIADLCIGESLPRNGYRHNGFRLHALCHTASLPLPSHFTLTKAAEAALEPYVPASIRTRLHARHGEWLAELRAVTVLFISLPSLPSAATLEQSQMVLCALEAELSRYEASINKLSADDKGTYLLAALGLPPLAHEDDPVRGVRAALAVSKWLTEFGWKHSIGITTGRVYCGVIGNEQRREYTLIGAPVNLAVRLMQAAENEILCDEPTYRAARDSVRFEALPKISVKGKTEAIAVFRPGAPRMIRGISAPGSALVGRRLEMAQISERIAALHAGTGGVILLEGEPGIGKSRLIDEIQEMAQERGVVCLKGEADSIEQQGTYFAWRHVFHRLLHLEDLPDSASRQQQVMEQLANHPETARFAPLLNDVLSLDLPENEETATLTGPARSSQTIHLLCSLLQTEASRSPLLLMVEDGHWMDSVSWALAGRVAQIVSPILFLLSSRPLGDNPSEEYQQVSNAPNAMRLTLEALPERHVTELVCARLGVDALPRPVADLILRKAEGNPLFSEQLALALRDEGVIEVNAGRCRLTRDEGDLHDLRFPDTVQGIITSRIDRLTPQQQLLIKIASVIGREFTVRTLRDIHPVFEDVSNLKSDLDVLARLDLTLIVPRAPEPTYLFKHAITQEVAYNLMLFVQRQQLHTTVAMWLETEYGDDFSAYYAILAYHWTRAAEGATAALATLQKSIEFCRRAGEQAMQVHAPIEAITHLSNALRVLTAIPDIVERSHTELPLQTLVAVALTLTRGWAAPDVGHAFQRAHKLCQELDDSLQYLPTLCGVLTFTMVGGQFRKALAMGEQNLQIAERFGDLKFILEAEQDVGANLFYMGDYEKAVPHLQRSASLYDPQNHAFHALVYGRDTRAVALLHEGLCAWCLGFPDRALALGCDAVSHTEQKNHPFSQLWALSSHVVILQMRGEFQTMQPLAQTLLNLATERGYPNWIAQAKTYLGWTQASQGQAQVGIKNMEEGVALWHSTGAQLLRPFLMYLLADGHARVGNNADALTIADEALALIDQTEECWWQPELIRLKGDLLLSQDAQDPVAAQLHFQQAITLAQASRARSLELRAAISFARLLCSQGRSEDARDRLEPIFSSFQEGHGTKDYQDAKSLLSTLNRSQTALL